MGAHGRKIHAKRSQRNCEKDIVKVPKVIRQASAGFKFLANRSARSFFTTDIAIIRNTNADAVIAVHPFTPHPAITKAIIEAADIPVFFGGRRRFDSSDFVLLI